MIYCRSIIRLKQNFHFFKEVFPHMDSEMEDWRFLTFITFTFYNSIHTDDNHINQIIWFFVPVDFTSFQTNLMASEKIRIKWFTKLFTLKTAYDYSTGNRKFKSKIYDSKKMQRENARWKIIFQEISRPNSIVEFHFVFCWSDWNLK